MIKIELNDATCEAIARKVAQMLKQEESLAEDEYVSTRQAAAMLNISTDRLRHIKDKFPHIKSGDNEKGKLLFLKKGLLKSY